MATVVYNVPRATINPGPVLTKHAITPPPGTSLLSYRLTAGDLGAPKVEDVTAWIQAKGADGRWREISRIVFRTTGESVGVLSVRDRALRVSATCGIRTVVSLLVEALAPGESPTPGGGSSSTTTTTTTPPPALRQRA